MRTFIQKPNAIRHGNSTNRIENHKNTGSHSILQLQRTIGNQAVLRMLQAQYTGNVTSGGYPARATKAGHTLAHEHPQGIQQRSIHASDPLIIQRQPKPDAPKQTPQPPPAKKKTLDDEGVGLDDPVSVSTAQTIDLALQRNQKLAPYIGDRLKSGFKIAEKGKFVKELSDSNFDASYRKAYELDSSNTVSSSTRGFYDPKTSEIHLRPDARFGTALHEAIHRLAAPSLYSWFLPVANQISGNLTEVLKEGVTAYFTDCVLNDEQLPNFNDANRDRKKKAESLVTTLGFDLVARFNFKGGGLVEIGNKLGLSTKQYGDLKMEGPKEVLKRINKLL